MRTGMTGRAWFYLILPSLSLTVTGLAMLLPGDRVSGIVEHFFDLGQRDDLGVVVDVDSFGWDINLDLAHTFQLTNGPLDRVLAMLARNVGGDKCCRFHDAYPPVILSNRLVSKRYNVPLQRCFCSELPSERGHDSIELPSFTTYAGLTTGWKKGRELPISSNRVELDQLLNDFLFAIAFNPFRDAGL
jgi:hypothetical protein